MSGVDFMEIAEQRQRELESQDVDQQTEVGEAQRRDREAPGAALLDEVRRELTRYVILPSPEAADAVTLFIAATHAQSAWEHATRLVIKSPLKRCGKTRLQEFCRETVHKALPATNISAAALVRAIDEADPPTLILDEADTVWGRKDQRSEAAEDIRGILNSGHSRGWPYVRWDASARKLDTISTFSMAIIGGIGDMPDTIEDRAVIVSMRRRAPGEQVAQWRSRRVVPVLHELRRRLHQWIRGHMNTLASAEPDVPVEDRAADVWEPLIAVADLAGEDWPDRARHACKVLVGAGESPEDGTASERLLADLAQVFGDAAHLPTAEIIQRLCAIEEAPWSTWSRGEPITARGLAALLRPYGVKAKVIRVGSATPRGYVQADLVDAWARYVPGTGAGAPPQHEQQPQRWAQNGWSEPVAHGVAPSSEQSATRPDQRERGAVAAVADVAQERLDRAIDGRRCEHWSGGDRRECGAPAVRRYLVGWRCEEHSPK